MLITVVHVDWSDHPNKCPGSDGARLDFREGVKVHPVLSGVLWNRKRHPEAIWRLPGDHQGYWLRSELRGHFSLTVKKSTLCFNMSLQHIWIIWYLWIPYGINDVNRLKKFKELFFELPIYLLVNKCG